MNILCKVGIHSDQQVGYGSLLFPFAVNKCSRCGRMWKFACTGDKVILEDGR